METLAVKDRPQVGKSAARSLRRQGLVPCVLYGAGKPARHLVVDARELAAVLRRGERIVSLMFEAKATGDGGKVSAFVKEVQYQAVAERVLHVDFVEVRMDRALTLAVPVRLRGSAKGLQAGGMVEQVLYEVQVTCLPSAIPDELVVSVENLGVGAILHVGDITPPAGVTFAVPADTAIATCHMPRGIKEEEAKPEEVVEPVRVEKKGKEEEEEAGEAADTGEAAKRRTAEARPPSGAREAGRPPSDVR